MAYQPNAVPAATRTFNIVASALLLIYGTYGILVNDLFIPGKRSHGVHLHDDPALAMYGAFVCACLVMMSVVVDHYDRRNNERKYRFFSIVFQSMGWSLFVLALVLHLVR